MPQVAVSGPPPWKRIEPGRASSAIVRPASALSSGGIGSDGRVPFDARAWRIGPKAVAAHAAAPPKSTARRENWTIASSIATRLDHHTRIQEETNASSDNPGCELGLTAVYDLVW